MVSGYHPLGDFIYVLLVVGDRAVPDRASSSGERVERDGNDRIHGRVRSDTVDTGSCLSVPMYRRSRAHSRAPKNTTVQATRQKVLRK